MDNTEDCKVNVNYSCRLDTPIVFDYLDSPAYPLTPQDITEFVAHHEIKDTSQNKGSSMNTATAAVLIDLPDLGFLDEVIIDSPGWKIEADRNRSSRSKNKCSINSYLKRILEDLAKMNAQVHDLRSEIATSEGKYRANRVAIAGLNETMAVQLKELTDKYKANRILEKVEEFRSSYSLEVHTMKELLASQEERLEAIHVIVELPGPSGTTTDADVGVGNSIPSSENLPIVIPDNSHEQPKNNVEQVNENVIECPSHRQSQNIQSSQPSTSRVSSSTTLHALRDISNNQRVSSVQIIQNQQPKPSSTVPDNSKKDTIRSITRSRRSPAQDEEGGRAKRARITLNQTTGTSNHDNGGRTNAKETCKNCFRILDKYYLKKPNGHRKRCKPKVTS